MVGTILEETVLLLRAFRADEIDLIEVEESLLCSEERGKKQFPPPPPPPPSDAPLNPEIVLPLLRLLKAFVVSPSSMLEAEEDEGMISIEMKLSSNLRFNASFLRLFSLAAN